MHGLQSALPAFMIDAHGISNAEEAKAYIERLNGYELAAGQIIQSLKDRAEKGIILPKYLIGKVKQDLQNITKGAPFDSGADSSPLLRDFSDKLEKTEMSESEKKAFQADVTTALLGGFKSGCQHMEDYLVELEALADNRAGVWKFPDGDAFYAYAVRQHTTTDLKPDEIHQKGLEEVERIHGEMKKVMTAVSFDGSLKAFFEKMRVDKQFYLSNDSIGRKAYLDRVQVTLDTMQARLPSMFSIFPKAELVVKPVEAFRAKSAGKAFYGQPSPDGTVPGIYYVNLHDMNAMPTYMLEALAFHEGIPGHHMQLALAQEMTDLPKFRRHAFFNSYIEGWGLYAESLAREMGFYQDPYDEFGCLSMELWRACRLVVDTGIHSKRWTKEEAIEYLKANTPNPASEIENAVNRYIVMPGQATSYTIGMLKIRELRERAAKKLGEDFELAEFHDLVLGNGALPLNLLEGLVDDWIAQKMTYLSK